MEDLVVSSLFEMRPSSLFREEITLEATGPSNETVVFSKKNLILSLGYNVFVFSVAAVPLFLIFAAHECTSIGYFLSTSVRCGNAVEFSSISPVWSRLFLVLYYYALCKFCIFIELF